MKPRAGVLVLLSAMVVASSSSTSVSAQQSVPSAAASSPSVPIIQIGLDLVRIDAAVIDRAGRPVTDLRPEDFTLEVDGRKQPVTNAAYFGEKAGPGDSSLASETPDGKDTIFARDTVVFMVDDLNMSFASVYAARRALSKFATEWVPNGATTAMRLTSDESGSFSIFRTSDQLLRAVSGLKYNIRSTQGISSTSSATQLTPTSSGRVSGPTGGRVADQAAMQSAMPSVNPTIALENMRQRVFSLVSTIDTLRSLPGRKAVVFLSEGFYFGGPRDDFGLNSPFNSLFDDTNIQAALRMITEVANRASVVLYAVDPRGLMIDASTAADRVTAQQAGALMNYRWQARSDSQASLEQLAADTGGIAVMNTNGLREGLDEVVRDHRAYYLVGFEPPEKTFTKSSGRPKFHKIMLRVNRLGVRVRTRAGFYGVTDAEVITRAPLSVAPSY